jgi:hypothetical protein
MWITFLERKFCPNRVAATRPPFLTVFRCDRGMPMRTCFAAYSAVTRKRLRHRDDDQPHPRWTLIRSRDYRLSRPRRQRLAAYTPNAGGRGATDPPVMIETSKSNATFELSESGWVFDSRLRAFGRCVPMGEWLGG